MHESAAYSRAGAVAVVAAGLEAALDEAVRAPPERCAKSRSRQPGAERVWRQAGRGHRADVGDERRDGDAAELCRPIECGVYVTRLWYTNAVRPKETLVTGLTRGGTFLIEDGEVVAPLEDMRMNDRVLAILERTEDLTSEPRLWNEGEFYGRRFATGVVCPALRASTVRFTA